MQQIRTLVAILSTWKYLVTISLVWLLGGFWLYKEGLPLTEITKVTTPIPETSISTLAFLLFFIISLIFQVSAVYVLLENNLWNSMLKDAEHLNGSKERDYKKLSDNFGFILAQLFNRPKLKNMTLAQRIAGTMRIAKLSSALFIANMICFVALGILILV